MHSPDSIILVIYLDLSWVTRLLSICEFSTPNVLLDGTYLYACFLLTNGTMYAGEIGGGNITRGGTNKEARAKVL